tara:strand:- start:132 stop:401 length:270 start_codon:yes stop_codon:yes gene_type:complete
MWKKGLFLLLQPFNAAFMLASLFFINVAHADMMRAGIADERQAQATYQYFAEAWISSPPYGLIAVGVAVYALLFFLEWKMLIGKARKDS